MRTTTGMSVIAISLLMLCTDCGIRCFGGEGHRDDNDRDRRAKLVEALAHLPVRGMHVGPVTAIRANKVTDAVVREGMSIVPTLVSALDHSSYNQTVWIVFCLAELRAGSAKATVIRVRQEEERGRFAAEPHDLTLSSEIKNYLRIVAVAEKERKK